MLWQGHCSASPARYTHTAYPVACGGGGGFVRTYTRCSVVSARVTCAGWFWQECVLRSRRTLVSLPEPRGTGE